MVKKALIWKLLERFGVQGTQFVLQVILARILDPEHYGILSLMAIFTTLANVFIQTGFNTALVQSKDVDDNDYSSVFWVTEAVAALLYLVLFFSAPFIANFYKMPEIVSPFRVMALILFPGAINSIQIAKVSRELNFKILFFSNFIAILISGLLGIYLAYHGFGIWALVLQNLINICLASAMMLFTVKWLPKLYVDFGRVKVLFSYGWKLLVSNLLENIYADLRSLVIGKKYDSTTLGYTNRGKQFPQFIMNATNEAVKSVMLPALAKEQDDRVKLKEMTRASILLSSYIIFPIMFGLAGVARPLISVLLTDKWLPAVIYMQIYCFALSFSPISSCNLQAINAIGRSDVYLLLEIIKRVIGTISIVIAVVFFKTPVAIAMTSLIMGPIVCFINVFPNKRLINYSYLEQARDIGPSLIAAISMFFLVTLVGKIQSSDIIKLFIQVVVGVTFYLFVSLIFKLKAYKMIMKVVKNRDK